MNFAGALLAAGAGAAALLAAEPQVAPSPNSTPQNIAPQIIYLVRHAERADDGMAQPTAPAPKDPALSSDGLARARRLAAMLRDAGVSHIFATEYRRTRQTAEPLATSAGLAIEMMPASDVPGLITRVLAHPISLVVGHSNTVPDILRALGVDVVVRLGDDEYDNLFVVVRPATGSPTLVRLRF